MLFTILCCISTGLTVFCIAKRVNKRAVEIAVRLAVREIEKEYEARSDVMKAQLARKEEELKKARDKAQGLVRLHEAVPSPQRRAPQAAAAPAKPRGRRADAAVHRHLVRRAAADDQRRADRGVGRLIAAAARRSRAAQGRATPNSVAPFSQPILCATGAGRSPSQRLAWRISAS